MEGRDTCTLWSVFRMLCCAAQLSLHCSFKVDFGTKVNGSWSKQ
jgi:hypothetical protein